MGSTFWSQIPSDAERRLFCACKVCTRIHPPFHLVCFKISTWRESLHESLPHTSTFSFFLYTDLISSVEFEIAIFIRILVRLKISLNLCISFDVSFKQI
jgi:hypothetical protein